MIKKILNSILFVVLTASLYGQYIPNPGFEDWATHKLYSDPTSWNSGNFQVYQGNYLTAVLTEDSYSGNYALKLRSASYQSDVLFGYIFSNGMLSNQMEIDTIQYSGGFPVTSTPDSLCGYIKHHIADFDSAIALVSFKKNGKVIGQNFLKIIGTSEYHKFSFDLTEMSDVPDTAMIAFACTNAFVFPVAGNYLIIDSLWFTGTADEIPNNSFENWDTIAYDEPVGWTSFNEALAVTTGELSVTQTDDVHSGNSALRIESKMTVFLENFIYDTITTGVLIPNPNNTGLFSQQAPFPIDINPNKLSGYYKFIPAGDDTAGVAINIIDDQGYNYYSGALLNPAGEYTLFEVPIEYPVGTVVTGINISFSTNYHEQGTRGELGSVLFLDDLSLTDPCEGAPEFAIVNTSTHPCDDQILDAGANWDEYAWSTGETTRTIKVELWDTYGVTVTNNTTGCYMMDTIFAGLTICDGIEENISMKGNITMYPVPASKIVNLEFNNIISGNYNLEIAAISGSIIRKEVIFISEKDETRQLQLPELSSGIYLLKISGENFSQVRKLKIE